jgi:hypothetical protein
VNDASKGKEMPLRGAKVVLYARELSTPTDVHYEDKFDELIRLCKEAQSSQADLVVVAAPQVLGDNYGEVMESLRRIASAELAVFVVANDKARPS